MKILDITSKYGKIFYSHRIGGKKKLETIRDFEWYFYVLGRDKEKIRPIAKFCNRIERHGNDYLKVYCDNDDLNRFDLEKGKIDNKTIVIRHCLQHSIPTFEADHGAWKRYLIDEGMEIDDDPVVGMFDIESWDKTDGIVIGRDRIVSFAVNIKGKDYFYTDRDERKILLKIKSMFEYCDIICGWNSTNFDIPYVLARFAYHGIQYYKNNIIHFDLMEIIKKKYKFAEDSVITNFNLENIGQLFLGEGKVAHSEKIWELFENNLPKLEIYNKQDTGLLYKLDNKLEILKLIIGICKESGTPYRHFYISEYIDNFILKEAKKYNKILPSNMWKLENKEGSSEKQKFMGGYCQEPIIGLHDNVDVYDLNSQYPNAMITFNISIDTFIGKTQPTDNDWIKTPTGCYFKRSFKGIIPMMLERLLIQRNQIKSEMKKYTKDSIEYKKLDNTQSIVKVVLNGTFGNVGSEYSRYYNIDMAESITGSSQYILKWIHKYCTLNNFMVLATDTDSVFIKENNK